MNHPRWKFWDFVALLRMHGVPRHLILWFAIQWIFGKRKF